MRLYVSLLSNIIACRVLRGLDSAGFDLELSLRCSLVIHVEVQIQGPSGFLVLLDECSWCGTTTDYLEFGGRAGRSIHEGPGLRKDTAGANVGTRR